MPPKKEVTGKPKPQSKDQDSKKDSAEARDLLMKITELMQKPSVRRDPVVRSLIEGLNKHDEFKTAGMAVATLRNAGCLGQSMAPSDSPKGKKDVDGPGSKKTPDKGAKPKATKVAAMRGFDRTLDYALGFNLIEENEPALVNLRKLRGKADRMVKFKKGDSNDIQERKVSQLGDWDLLYLEDPTGYDALLEKLTPYKEVPPIDGQNGYYPNGAYDVTVRRTTPKGGAFGWINVDNPYCDEFLAELKELHDSHLSGTQYKLHDGSVLTWDDRFTKFRWAEQVRLLKGRVLDTIVKNFSNYEKDQVGPGASVYKLIADTLVQEVWWKFGKSPTINRA